MNDSPVAGVVRGWVRLYTRGLPAPLRSSRCDEIDDDLWCEHEEAAALGRSARSLDANLVLRLLFGLPADISWRLSYRRHPATPNPVMGSTINTRTLGVFAIVAATIWVILLVPFIPFGDGVWTGRFGVLGITGSIASAIAFSVAALGLSWRFQDRAGPLCPIGALLVTLGAIASVAGSVVLLVIGSAMLIWDLARIGVVPRSLSIIHLVAVAVVVLALVIGPPSPNELASRGLLVAVLVPYVVTWLAIGVVLLRGVPQARATSA
jgi:hypothetical protein